MGAPQGTVLAPFLFTYDARSAEHGCSLLKLTDDTAMVGLINGNDDNQTMHILAASQIQSFVNYCDVNFLELNV